MKDILNYYKYIYKIDLQQLYTNFGISHKTPEDCIGLDLNEYIGLDLKKFEPEFGKLNNLRNPFYFIICLFFETLFDQGVHYSNIGIHNSYFKNRYPKLCLGFTNNISPCNLLKIAEIYVNNNSNFIQDTISIASFHFIKYYEQIFSNILFNKDEKNKFYSSVAHELEIFLQSPDEEIKPPKGAAWEDKEIILMMGKSVLAHIYQKNQIN